MAATQLVQTRIDGAIKAEAAAVLASMGLTVSDAVRLLLTKVAQDKALPFEPLIPNATTIQAMKDARAGKVTQVVNLEALFADLHATPNYTGQFKRDYNARKLVQFMDVMPTAKADAPNLTPQQLNSLVHALRSFQPNAS